MMRKGKSRFLRRLAVYCIVFILLGSILFGLGLGAFKLFNILFGARPLVEDENMVISVPNEEIVFKKGTEGLFRYETVSKKLDKLTDGNDFAPSWNEAGNGLHFLRKMNDGSLHLFFIDFSNRTVIETEGVEPLTILEIPNIERDIVKISPDGTKIAVSSYDWGIQFIDLAKRGVNSDIKERDMKAYEKCWDMFDHFSRNSKFFLFTVTNPYTKQFVSGSTTRKPGSALMLAHTDLTGVPIQVDLSDNERFLGYSFSPNAYSFAYSKGESLYYVDSIKDPKPYPITVGTFPAIRPNKTKKYTLRKPFWVSFDFTNVAGFILTEAFGKKFVIAGTPHYLATIDLADQRVQLYSEKFLGSQSIYLGWKLIDLMEEDLNKDSEKEILASWWAGGSAIGAEKIVIFKLTKKGTLTKLFESKNRDKNSLQISDLNGDDFKEVFNLYLDNGGSDNAALEGLYWKDIYSWRDNKLVMDNQKYPEVYKELIDKYQTFMSNAIKNPDQYGNNLYMIQRLLKQAREIASPPKK